MEAINSSTSVNDDIIADEELLPPENFAMIERGLYRSAFPKKKNFSFLKAIGIKSILYVRDIFNRS